MKNVLFSALLVLLVLGCAQEQRTETDTVSTATEAVASPTVDMTATPAATADSPDKDFAMKAAAGGLAEVELGTLASQKATDPGVKSFGERMVQDHGKANSQLM